MMRAGALSFSRWRRSLLSRNGARWLTAQVSSMPSFVSCRVPYARPGLAATNDRKVRAERGERFCRRQANAIGGTRDQDLLAVHDTSPALRGRASSASAATRDAALEGV